MKINIDAVHDEDLEKYLKKLGIYEDIVNKKIRCRFCNNVITLNNIIYIYPHKGEIRIICDNPQCCFEALKEMRENELID